MFVRLLLYSQYVLIQLLGVNYSSSTDEENLGDDLKHFAAEQERDLFEQCTKVCECVRSPPRPSLFSRFQVNLMCIKVEGQIPDVSLPPLSTPPRKYPRRTAELNPSSSEAVDTPAIIAQHLQNEPASSNTLLPSIPNNAETLTQFRFSNYGQKTL
jgi:hypothetical protein